MSHWYVIEDGVAKRYEQLTKKGEPSKRINRKRALADGAVEGVTSLLKRFEDQSGLVGWAGKLGVEAAVDAVLAIEQPCPSDLVEAKNLLMATATELYDLRRNEASEAGSAIHDAIDKYLSLGLEPQTPEAWEAARAVSAWIEEQGITERRAEHCVVYRDGSVAFGGTPDLLSRKLVADWKTLEEKRGKFRDPLAKEAAQLAAYRAAAAQMGLCDADAECYNLYIERSTGKLVRVHKWSPQQVVMGWSMIELSIAAEKLVSAIEA